MNKHPPIHHWEEPIEEGDVVYFYYYGKKTAGDVIRKIDEDTIETEILLGEWKTRRIFVKLNSIIRLEKFI